MWQKNEFSISTDKSLLDVDVIFKFISCESYWGQGRGRELIQKTIDNSTYCFGVYQGTKQVGFARVVSDLATFGFLADVFILSDYRGQGLGKWLLQTIINHPELAKIKRLTLFTKTPDFYYDAGFEIFSPTNEIEFMERKAL